jgi:hypothetical protein
LRSASEKVLICADVRQRRLADRRNRCPEIRSERTIAQASSEKYDMDLPVWNAHERVVTLASPRDDRHAAAISACPWHTPPNVGQRWQAGPVGASGWRTCEPGRNGRHQGAATKAAGWRTPEPDLGVAGEEFARIVFELLWSEGGFGGTEVSGGRPLECVWSSLDGCSCGANIPTDAAARAWARELDATGELEDRFFHFIWEGGVWVAYGVADGDVRGAQCPSHNSERAERSYAARFGEGVGAGAIVCELALAA